MILILKTTILMLPVENKVGGHSAVAICSAISQFLNNTNFE